jgi:hypothetical protein
MVHVITLFLFCKISRFSRNIFRIYDGFDVNEAVVVIYYKIAKLKLLIISGRTYESVFNIYTLILHCIRMYFL